jgi:DMATS type aromatic prenyltransferase
MMLAPWGEQPVPAVPLWRSDIGDDHSPFEFSVAFSEGKSDLRLLVEGQGGGNLASQREACLRLNESLGQKGSDLRRLMMLVDLLIPETAELEDPLFFLWHMVSLSSDSLRVKSYFNPNVRGAGRANELMKAAFERLGLDAPWRTFEEAQRRLRGKDLLLFCLDLEDTPSARVKIYPHPQGATAEDLERVSQLGSKHVPGEVAEFCRVLTGSSGPYVRGPRVARTPIVYLAFTRNEETPSDITVQVPIRFYAADDAVARDRVCGYLQLRGLDPAPYERALEAVSKRPWKAGRGLNAWVSLRTGSNPPLVTVYFAAELYRVLPRGEESGLF